MTITTPKFETRDGKILLLIPADCTMHELCKLEITAKKMADDGDAMARQWIVQRLTNWGWSGWKLGPIPKKRKA